MMGIIEQPENSWEVFVNKSHEVDTYFEKRKRKEDFDTGLFQHMVLELEALLQEVKKEF